MSIAESPSFQPFPEVNSVRISHSTQQSSLSCARRGFEFHKLYSHGYRDTSLPAEVGKALHSGYQEFLQSGDREKAMWAMMMGYPWSFLQKSSEARSVEACYATMQLLMDNNAMVNFELATFERNGEIVPAIEVPFEIKFPHFSLSEYRHIPVTYAGFMDIIAYDHLLGEYVVIDIKTHRDWVDDQTAKYQYDEQVLPYALVLAKLLGKEINSLRVIYLSTFVDVMEPKVRKYDFQKSSQDIQDWARGLFLFLNEMKTFFDLEWFPRKASACMSWNRPCQHLDVCNFRDAKSIQQYMDLTGSKFKQMEIDPWVSVDLEMGGSQ